AYSTLSLHDGLPIYYDESIGTASVVPQEIGRVLLNLLGNAFYVVREKSASANGDYVPTVSVSTRREGDVIELRVEDNGLGIPDEDRKSTRLNSSHVK